MEGKSYVPVLRHLRPQNKPDSQPCPALGGAGQEVDGAEASSRAMHEVRRSILRKLAPCFRGAGPWHSHTQ